MRTISRLLARMVGLGRAAAGLWLLASPAVAAEAWTGTSRYPAVHMVRGVAARDVAIGAGLALGRRSLRGWLLASVLSDLFDVWNATQTKKLGRQRRRMVTSMAGSWAALGALALLGAGSSRERPATSASVSIEPVMEHRQAG